MPPATPITKLRHDDWGISHDDAQCLMAQCQQSQIPRFTSIINVNKPQIGKKWPPSPAPVFRRCYHIQTHEMDFSRSSPVVAYIEQLLSLREIHSCSSPRKYEFVWYVDIWVICLVRKLRLARVGAQQPGLLCRHRHELVFTRPCGH